MFKKYIEIPNKNFHENKVEYLWFTLKVEPKNEIGHLETNSSS